MQSLKKTVSLILARKGNSKQEVPFKNICNIYGRPLISYSIEQSILTPNIDETWVSSNCKKTLDIAKNWGANTIYRPDEISGPFSHNEEAMLHFSKQHNFDSIICIQPTSPLVTKTFFQKAIDFFHKNSDVDSVFSCNELKWTPTWKKTKESSMLVEPSNWDIKSRPMRQEAKELFEENGAFYITSKDKLEKSKSRYSGNIHAFQIPKSFGIQLDSQEDLLIIKSLIKLRPYLYNLDFSTAEDIIYQDINEYMSEELQEELKLLDKKHESNKK